MPPGPDELRWLVLHGKRDGPYLSLECKCSALTAEGRCGIYADRPMVCRVYQPGGADCLKTVKARRTPEQYQEIREDGDPLTLEDYS